MHCRMIALVVFASLLMPDMLPETFGCAVACRNCMKRIKLPTACTQEILAGQCQAAEE